MNSIPMFLLEQRGDFTERVLTAAEDIGSSSVHIVPSKGAMVEALTGIGARDGLAICNWEEAFDANADELARLRRQFPYVSFVIHSASNSLAVPQQVLAAGASGFFRRDSPVPLIRRVLDLVLSQEAFVLPSYLR